MNPDSWGKGKSLLLFLFFLCMAVFITWPLLPNITSSLYGKVGDPTATVWSLKWFKEAAFSQSGSMWHFPYAAYPHGVKTSFSIAFFPLVPLFAYPHGETVLYNLIIIFFLALNGYVMFLLGRKLYGSNAAAFAMGLIYLFCPYAVTRAKYHLSLVPIFIFPLLIYTLVNLKQRFTTANKVKAFLALLLAFNTHPYNSAMTMALLAILSLCYAARKIRGGIKAFAPDYRFLRVCLLFLMLVLLITLTLSYIQLGITRGDGATVGRSEGDLYTYAGHAWNYLTPSPNSYLFGDSVSQFVRGRVSATNIEEYILFLGYVNMGLALIALLVWFSRRWYKPAGRLTGDLDGRAGWVVPFALLTAAVSFVLSLPPTIKLAGFTLYMPSWFISRLTATFRVYARFGVLIFFSVTLLSGMCIAFLDKALRNLGSTQSRWTLLRYALIALLLVLIVCEFAEVRNNPMQEMYDQKPVYAEVQALPADAVIAEYPFVASDEAYTSLYLWNAIFHGKNMLNGYGQGTEGESMRNCVLNLLDAKTPGLLAYMGAGYAAVHKDLYAKGSAYSYRNNGGLDLLGLPAGFRLVYEDADSALLAIEAERPGIVVIYEPKFSTVITPEFGNGWWMGAEKEWMMKIDSLEERIVDIRFQIFSVQGERTLRVDLGGGRVESYRIGEDDREIIIPQVQLSAGINRIYLSTDEEPTPYKEVYGGYDSKGVCFAMSFWDVR